MAGRALENAGNVALQKLNQPERAADLYKRASELFMQNMTPDRAAEMLEKSAIAMAPISVDSAVELYIGACNIYESEDRGRYATDTFKKTISLLVKHNRFEKAIEVLQRLGNIQKDTPNKSAYYKTLLSIIIIQLAAGDEVEAGKRFQAFCSVEGFIRSEESAIAHAMLDAFEHRDQAYYNKTAGRQHVGFLDNEVARVARNIVISNDLISSGGYINPSQPSILPLHHQQHQQRPYYQQGPPGPTMQTTSLQANQGPYSSRHSQSGNGQDGIYRAYPVTSTPNYSQQRPISVIPSGGYGDSPPDSAPPPYSDERNEEDWRALTEKSFSSPAPPLPYRQQQPPPPPHQQQQPLSQQSQRSLQSEHSQRGIPSNRNIYDNTLDDEDDLL
ncbi:hypothetical protein BGZ46_006193 [Entomortierella lignicola]|nr:hypothetical protein BGZ46_006193 [Entomortierella lignicola]